MPLVFAPLGKQLIIVKVAADDKVRRHLADIGLVINGVIEVTGCVDGDIVVAVKNSRIALNRQLAMNIFVK